MCLSCTKLITKITLKLIKQQMLCVGYVCVCVCSIDLGFSNPMSQLREANVIGFCMQLGNSEDS